MLRLHRLRSDWNNRLSPQETGRTQSNRVLASLLTTFFVHPGFADDLSGPEYYRYNFGMRTRWIHQFAVWVFLALLLVPACSPPSDPIPETQVLSPASTALQQPVEIEEEVLAESIDETEAPASLAPGQSVESGSPEEAMAVDTSNHSTASTWGQRAPLPEPNSEIAVAQLDGKIYVVGGYPSSRSTVASVQVYDSASDSWSLASPVPVPLNHAMAAAFDGRLYVIGGQGSAAGSGPFLDTVFIYDPGSDSWSSGTPMPTARGGGAAAVIDGKVYVVGGRPPHGADFAVYDPGVNAWTALPDMPTPRNHLAAVAVSGRLYVIGGRFGAGFQSEMTDAVEIFDPLSNTWSAGSSMPTVRGGLNAVAAAGCVHVFGGEGSGGVFPQHEAYDPFEDAWFSFAPMPVPVHGVTGAAYLDGLIHLPGGGTQVGGSSGSTIHQVVEVEMRCAKE